MFDFTFSEQLFRELLLRPVFEVELDTWSDVSGYLE